MDDQLKTLQSWMELFEQSDATEWHIISDKTKVVDSTKLADSIGSGAIVVQTSRDGRSWINVDTETDIYNKQDMRVYDRIAVVRYNKDYMLPALRPAGRTYADRLENGFDMYY